MNSKAQSYGKAFAWTVVLTATYMGLHYVPLPTAAPLLQRLGEFKGKYLSTLNIMALGLTPVISAFFYVEVLSLILKPLSRWRLEGTSGRQKLNQTAWVTTLLITFIQAWGTSYLVMSLDTANPPVLNPAPGLLFHIINITTLMAGTCLAIWLARMITQLGVGNGFLILALPYWLKSICIRAYGQITDLQKPINTSNDLFSWDLFFILAVLATTFLWKFIQRGPKVPIKLPNGKLMRYEISPMPPSAGTQNYSISLLATISGLLTLWHIQTPWMTKGWPHITLEILLVGLLSWLLYNLLWGEFDIFGLAVNELPGILRKREKLLGKQTLKATAILIGGAFLFWMPLSVTNLDSPFWVVRFGILIEVLAVLQDLWAQWAFWRTHGQGVELLEMDNVHLASYLKGLFQAEGMPCHIQAYGYRRLFFIFSPLNKMRLLVPEEVADKARELLTTVKYQVV